MNKIEKLIEEVKNGLYGNPNNGNILGLIEKLEEINKPVETTNEQPKVIIKMSKDEAQKILHIISRTIARNNCGNMHNILDIADKIEEDIRKQLG